MEEFEEKFKVFVINRCTPFPVILKKAGFEGYDNYSGKVFCPFHQNYHSPSAKLFRDKDGDRLFCFSENRIYRPVDVIKKGMIDGSIDRYFNRIWSQLPQGKKEVILAQFDEPVSIIPEGFAKSREKLALFKRGKVSLSEHLSNLIEALESR